MDSHFRLLFTEPAAAHYRQLEKDKSKVAVLKAVRKTLGLMEVNLRHPSLKTHEYTSLKGPEGEKVFEAYVQNKTPGAYRVFWHYGPGKGVLTIIAITPHP